MPPADPETPLSLKEIVVGLFGLGGTAGAATALRTIGRYEQRVETLEDDVASLKATDERHDEKLGQIETTLSALHARSEQAVTDRAEMKADQREILRLLRGGK